MQLAKKIKELQNLYSWNQFYQETKNRSSGSKCQTQIRIVRNEINELKKNVEKITKKIIEIKTSLIDFICELVQSKYSQISISDKISLVKNIYLILTSSIQTLDAKFVEVEQNT